jgi:hypothetical protein
MVFSEVMYDTPGKDSEEEWIELSNPTAEPVNLSGWKIQDNSGSWSLPEHIIEAGSHITIARNTEGFTALYSCQPAVAGLSRGLNNDGDQLFLLDANDAEQDFVAWESEADGDHPDWKINAGKGKSIKRAAAQDTDTQEDWLSDQEPDPAC